MKQIGDGARTAPSDRFRLNDSIRDGPLDHA